MTVEVERKFLCTADTLKTLDELGGTCVTGFPHIHIWVNLELRHLTDAMILISLQMITEALLQHLMTVIAVVCTITVLAICLLLIL